MKEVKLVYLHESGISQEDYISFLKSYYNKKSFERHFKRDLWYSKWGPKHILLALYDNEIVGQSCVYRVQAMLRGQSIEWWWGVDAFVIEKSRGLGIGKKLQKKLADDHPNVSSACYSRINGIVKRKIGQTPFCEVAFGFYPCSRFFSVAIELLYYKILKKRVNVPIRIPNFYYYLRSIGKSNLNNYNITETQLDCNVNDFIDNSLSKRYDFYIVRDQKYLDWKYKQNPTLKYSRLFIKSESRVEAIVMLSKPFYTEFIISKVKAVNLLDYFITPESNLKLDDIIHLVMRYHKDRGSVIDGIKAIGTTGGWLRFIYPYPSVPLLSSHDGEKPKSSYIAYSDQDMEQM